MSEDPKAKVGRLRQLAEQLELEAEVLDEDRKQNGLLDRAGTESTKLCVRAAAARRYAETLDPPAPPPPKCPERNCGATMTVGWNIHTGGYHVACGEQPNHHLRGPVRASKSAAWNAYRDAVSVIRE